VIRNPEVGKVYQSSVELWLIPVDRNLDGYPYTRGNLKANEPFMVVSSERITKYGVAELEHRFMLLTANDLLWYYARLPADGIVKCESWRNLQP